MQMILFDLYICLTEIDLIILRFIANI